VVNDETQSFLASIGNPYLSKPFQLDAVRRAVAQVLDAENERAGLLRLFDDKVIYAFTEALRRVTRPTISRCPNRITSKTSLPTLNEQRNHSHRVAPAAGCSKICSEKLRPA